jgi:hypothetical protein
MVCGATDYRAQPHREPGFKVILVKLTPEEGRQLANPNLVQRSTVVMLRVSAGALAGRM